MVRKKFTSNSGVIVTYPLRMLALGVAAVAATIAAIVAFAMSGSSDSSNNNQAAASPSPYTISVSARLGGIYGYTLTNSATNAYHTYEEWTLKPTGSYDRTIILADGHITAVRTPDGKMLCTVPLVVQDDIAGATLAFSSASVAVKHQTAGVTHMADYDAYEQTLVVDGTTHPYVCQIYHDNK